MTESTLVMEKQIITPLELVLNEVTSQPQKESSNSSNNTKSVSESLDVLFPEQQYDEKNIQKAMEILGSAANKFSKEELKGVITDVQFLVDSWLDDFEREIFDGLTLRELLHEKGGV